MCVTITYFDFQCKDTLYKNTINAELTDSIKSRHLNRTAEQTSKQPNIRCFCLINSTKESTASITKLCIKYFSSFICTFCNDKFKIFFDILFEFVY